jgi:uncharacterized protein YjbI with pentapeptide repeats
MAWITLALAPIYVVLAFQFAFLPYHSDFATWTHRFLVFVELAIALLLWPLVLDARRDFDWAKLKRPFAQTISVPADVLVGEGEGERALYRLRLQVIPIIAFILFVTISVLLAAFPGEPHVNILAGKPRDAVGCHRRISQNFDRLELAHANLVDRERLERIEKATAARGEPPSNGERTQILRDRDLNCGVFNYADLRRIDFSGARLVGAALFTADLEGASLNFAQLQAADLRSAALQRADLRGANIQGAHAAGVQLQGAQGASLEALKLDLPLRIATEPISRPADPDDSVQLQGADLRHAQLQGSDLRGAQLQGVDLEDANLEAANLRGAKLTGANLALANLKGANLSDAELQGAILIGAQLQAADARNAQLQGANLDNGDLTLAFFPGANVWRAQQANCSGARVTELSYSSEPSASHVSGLEGFIEEAVANIGERKEEVRTRLRQGLISPLSQDLAEINENWRKCSLESEKVDDTKFFERHSKYLIDLICNATANRKEIAESIIQIWVFDPTRRDPQFARRLIESDCAAIKELSSPFLDRLREFTAIPKSREP